MAAAGLALLLGGGFGLQHWFETRLQREREISTTAIVVARHALDQGSALGGFDWRSVNWPSESVPEGAILEASGLEGRVLSASLQPGEPIVIGKLAPVGAMTGLVQRLRPGHRALSVKVNEASGVNGFIQPGHRVDVIAHLPGQGAPSLGALARNEEAVSFTVLQDLLVLAVDREASAEQAKPRQTAVVTLELAPQDAERLEHARNAGTVSLILRADGDRAPWSSRGETRASLREGLNRVHAGVVPHPRGASLPSTTRPSLTPTSRTAAALDAIAPAFAPEVAAAVPAVAAAVPAVPAAVPAVPAAVPAIATVAPAVAPTLVGSERQATQSNATNARLESEDATAPHRPGPSDTPTQSTQTIQTRQTEQTPLAAQPSVEAGGSLPGTLQAVIPAKQIAVRKPRCIEVYDGERRHQECLR